MSELQSALFVSHGAPTLALDDSEARRRLIELGKTLTAPEAIILASAHHVSRTVEITSAARPGTIYDFRGFPKALYEIEYPAPGSPRLAGELLSAFTDAGHDAVLNPSRGFDHGAWVPLSLLFPNADVPVVQVAIDPSQGPRHHFSLGRALAPFRRRGVMVVGSGSLTHNLPAFFEGGYAADASPPDWVSEFAEWVADALAAGDRDALFDAVDSAPHGRRNHPTLEHFLPLFVAAGAAFDGEVPERLFSAYSHGVLAMDAYGFGTRQVPNG